MRAGAWPSLAESRRQQQHPPQHGTAAALRRGPGARRPVARVHGARRPGRHPAVPAGPMNPGRVAEQARRAAGSAGSRPSPARTTMSWHSPYNCPRLSPGSLATLRAWLSPKARRPPRPWPDTANPGTTSPHWPADSPKSYRFTPRHDCRLRAADPYPDNDVPLITSRNQPSPPAAENIRLCLLVVVGIPWLIAAPKWMFGAAIMGQRHERHCARSLRYRG